MMLVVSRTSQSRKNQMQNFVFHLRVLIFSKLLCYVVDERHFCYNGEGYAPLSTCQLAKCGMPAQDDLTVTDQVFIAFKDDCTTVHFEDPRGDGPERYSVVFDSNDTETIVKITRKRTLCDKAKERLTKIRKVDKKMKHEVDKKMKREMKEEDDKSGTDSPAKKQLPGCKAMEKADDSSKNIERPISGSKGKESERDSRVKPKGCHTPRVLEDDDSAIRDVIEILDDDSVKPATLPVIMNSYSINERRKLKNLRTNWQCVG